MTIRMYKVIINKHLKKAIQTHFGQSFFHLITRGIEIINRFGIFNELFNQEIFALVIKFWNFDQILKPFKVLFKLSQIISFNSKIGLLDDNFQKFIFSERDFDPGQKRQRTKSVSYLKKKFQILCQFIHYFGVSDFDYDLLVIIFQFGSVDLSDDARGDSFLLNFFDLVVYIVINKYFQSFLKRVGWSLFSQMRYLINYLLIKDIISMTHILGSFDKETSGELYPPHIEVLDEILGNFERDEFANSLHDHGRQKVQDQDHHSEEQLNLDM